MLQHKAYKFRIYPNRKQIAQIEQTFGCCRFVYNRFLDLQQQYYKTEHKRYTYNAMSSMLTKIKKEVDTSFLKNADSTALQEALRNLDNAYINFFEKRAHFPKFKSKHQVKQSYRTRNQNDSVRIEDNKIILPKLGALRAKLHREVRGRILNATVSKSASGKYYVSLCCEENITPLWHIETVTGLDLGLHDFCVLDDGTKIPNPKNLRNTLQKLKRAQQSLCRKQKGSKNREKQRKKVALIYEKVVRQRDDFIQKLSSILVNENQVICIEDLNIKGMVRNHHLALSISDVAWGKFISCLEYKASWYGRDLIKVDHFYASSQLCHCCGYQNPNVKDLKIREWDCPQCGMHNDRDVNAAKNILAEGLRIIG